ncbi:MULTISPECIES: undecaprenyl-diphosphate phosphatase [Pasteurellaceae]|uniref:Undecaprenyl-diphosphatase n=1 Tax=Pasteurella atlantica TaxID=2827233 RepID=A0AAW8CKI8_9PAST|nr:undecaprenyl-diphosphate phosphatase [Pasteurella atlantica]MBR0573271.1 undecaprenyl-diphosphate phosphatase [Pasteurella atlantica]MDP8039113.1 undecaprenyl-diphosphate phosphatase [Pasteurella atlantica]MDP8041288.1 undecaprenyl-diphosphate phosphatase [Pasteurella atlantica]MDP8043425.1 undecaprenyl-diphosphate phosphatase [Pasteurella atlantica]MDP8045511.1 undecaprenyl-diphosphate phosphatase [Pasteurella atlantica]
MDFLLIIKTLIMGIVEGITEFLPISSTGYLILSADLMDFWTVEKSDLFIVVIQLGAILAVIYDYWGRLWHAFIGLITGKAEGLSNPRQLGFSLIVATIPVMIVGFTFADQIKAYLFHPIVVAVMLIIGGLLIFYVEKLPKQIIATEAEEVDIKTALKIGLFQCLALIPGTSRSGSTIIGALWLGVSRKAAAEFSFFLGIPVLIGAGLLDLLKHKDLLQFSEDMMVLGLGTLISFIVALLCIRWLVAWVSRRDFTIFAWLRIITGVIVLIASWSGYNIQG